MDDVPSRATADIKPHRFYSKYVTEPDGSIREVHWVEYHVAGEKKYTITPDAVSRMMQRTDGSWECLKPYYDAWVQGHEAPTNGTPLSAWSGVSPEMAELLKLNSLRTVEDIGALTDAQMARLKLPNLRQLRDQARVWDEAKDARKVETQLAKKDEQLALMQSQIDDLMALLSKAPELADDLVPAKPRGRRSKSTEPAEVEE